MSKEGRRSSIPKAYYDQDAISIYPTSGGAHNWSPMSYNPNTGLVYIPAFYTSFNLQAQAEFRPARTATSGRTVHARGRTNMGPEPPAGARGGLQAWDPVTAEAAVEHRRAVAASAAAQSPPRATSCSR
jgi:hypothetical protein